MRDAGPGLVPRLITVVGALDLGPFVTGLAVVVVGGLCVSGRGVILSDFRGGRTGRTALGGRSGQGGKVRVRSSRGRAGGIAHRKSILAHSLRLSPWRERQRSYRKRERREAQFDYRILFNADHRISPLAKNERHTSGAAMP